MSRTTISPLGSAFRRRAPDRHRHRTRDWRSAGVAGVVERGADVVARVAVDGDVRVTIEGDPLDGADLVDGDRARPDDRPTGLDRQRGCRRPAATTPCALDCRGQPLVEISRCPGSSLDTLAIPSPAQTDPGNFDAGGGRGSSQPTPMTRWAATSNPDVSNICEPKCECRPASCSVSARGEWRRPHFGIARRHSEREASANFWSSCAVAMNSCVCASTPTVTRTSRARAGRRWPPPPPSPSAGGSRRRSRRRSVTDARRQPLCSKLGSRLVVAVQRDPSGRKSGSQRH